MSDAWILSERRTGSSYLCEVLNGTGLFQIKFREWYVKFDHLDYLTDFYRCKGCPYKNVGEVPKNGKIHWDAMMMAFGTFENFVKNLKEPKFIQIVRENKMEMAISHAIAIKTKCYELRNIIDYEEWKRTKVCLSASEIQKIYSETKRSEARWENEINKNLAPHIKVVYEKILNKSFCEIRKVLNFVGLDADESTLKNAFSYADNSIIKQDHPDKIRLIKKFSRKIHI
jgi:LPS sulfotransferase NodH